MPSCLQIGNAIFTSSPPSHALSPITNFRHFRFVRINFRAFATPRFSVPVSHSFGKEFSDGVNSSNRKHSIHYDSLRVLEWDKLCDSVASFARTSPGREATKAQLWSLNKTYEESLRLLDETNAAVEMYKHSGCSLDLSGIDLLLVKSAIRHARRSSPMDANEAMAVASLLQFADSLQCSLKAAIKEDADWYMRFMPLAEVIMELVVNQPLVKLIQKVIGEDGSVKDSASSALKRSREEVRLLEKKLSLLMDRLIRNEKNGTPFLEASNVDGRWCIKSAAGAGQLTGFKGLLLSSASGMGSIVEPLAAIPLNDELQQAKASVAKAEADVLYMLTEKMKMDLDDIENLLETIIQLDVVHARASYGLSYGGTCPNIYLPEAYKNSNASAFAGDEVSNASQPIKKEWMLYMPKAHHPLLLQQFRENLKKAKRDAKDADNRKRFRGENMTWKGQIGADLPTPDMVTALEQANPIPVDFLITQKNRVLVITGPNTGGKTICLKTIGLAAMMAKSGLHVLASESVQIPWFDSVFADIGDEQSLSQSLSTFSGHLKKISEIQSVSTRQSLVLLDEVGAGTNPIEGAALGMSLLESFAESGALLTIATTHHGELKTLKYSNDAFENASMEFDEVNLKPTYRILWGVPGRSNAINIAERLGLPGIVVDNARKLYGAASAEIDEVIIDMESIKQNYEELLRGAKTCLTNSKVLYENLLLGRREVLKHSREKRLRKVKEISEAASMARSIIHKKAQKLRVAAIQPLQPTTSANRQRRILVNDNKPPAETDKRATVEDIKQSSGKSEFPKVEVGDSVHVNSLGKKATVLSVEPSKEEVVVQVGSMKLKLKLVDLKR